MVNPMEIAMKDMSRLIDLANAKADTIPEVVNANGPVYGAVPGAADNTAALQKAIDAAKAAGRSEVYLSPGHYDYTSLTNTDGIVIVGDGVTLSGSPTIPVVSTAQLVDIETLNVKSFGVIGDGITDDSDALQLAFSRSKGKLLLIPDNFEVRITKQINISDNMILECKGKIICDGDVDFWIFGENLSSITLRNIKIEVTKQFNNRTKLNRAIRVEDSKYFEVTFAEIIGASTAIHCLGGEVFVCGDILLRNVYGVNAQYGYGINTSAKHTTIRSVTAINDSDSEGRHVIYVNGSSWENVSVENLYVRNWNKNPVNITHSGTSPLASVYIGSVVFDRVNVSPTTETTGAIHNGDEIPGGVSVNINNIYARNVLSTLVAALDNNNSGFNVNNLQATDVLETDIQNARLVYFRFGSNKGVRKLVCDSLNTGWLCAIYFSDCTDCYIDDVQVGGLSGSQIVRVADSSVSIGSIVSGITKVFQSGANIHYKNLQQAFIYRSAPPSDGSWVRNTICWNTAASTGAPLGWVCTSAGSPGTWRPFGQAGAATSISSSPLFEGQVAVVGGEAYIAVGTSDPNDWKQAT